ncbi:MAG: KilA-N domain-containing protein [Prevotellaceae bacterium]|jgi:hypothetical protein|nr:KilA-N domain-containing protein [Prevotellaceae bacterium]
MKTEICKFNEHDVTFMLAKDANMMVNATEMAKIFDKYPKDFIILESTKLFILACLKKENSPFLNIEKEEDLIVSKQKSGTWMHRVLALKFAAWLSSDFEVWVYSTIEKLLFGRHVQREESFERILLLQKELEELRDKPQKTGEDFERYLYVQKQLRHETALRKSLLPKACRACANCLKNKSNVGGLLIIKKSFKII